MSSTEFLRVLCGSFAGPNAAAWRIAQRRDGAALYGMTLTSPNGSEGHLAGYDQALRLIGEALDGFTYSWDLESGQVDRSEGLAGLLGYAPDEVEPTALWWRAQVHPDDLPRVLAASRVAFDDVTVRRLVSAYRVRHRDGGYRQVEDRARLVRTAAGRVARVVGVTVDVSARQTARARADALQRLSAALARSLTREQAARIIVDHAVDALGAFSGSVFELSPDSTLFELLAGTGYGEDVPLRDVARMRDAVFLESRAQWIAHFEADPALLAAGATDGAWAALPFVVDDRLCGALTLSLAGPHVFDDEERGFLRAYANQAAQAIERARLLDAEREARARTERLQHITATLAGVTTERDVADALLAHLEAVLAPVASAFYRVVPGDGSGDALELLRHAGLTEAEAHRNARFLLDSDVPIAEIARRGESVFLESYEAYSAYYPHWPSNERAGNREAWVGIALSGSTGEPLGGVAFGFREQRPFSSDERRYVEALIHQGAQALERARLLGAERRARAAAVADASRVGELQALTAALASAVTPEDVADVALERARPAFGAGAGLLNVLTDDGRDFVQLRSAGFHGELARARRRYPLDARLPGAEAVHLGVPLFVSSFDEMDERFPALAPLLRLEGYPSFTCLPLVSGGRVLGVLVFNFAEERIFTPAEREQLRAFAGQCALALARARLYETEREAREKAEMLSGRLADVLETMSDALFEFDRSWRLIRLNAAARGWLRALGLEPEGVLGRSPSDIDPTFDTRPDGEALRRAMAGESVRYRSFLTTPGRWVELRAYPTGTGIAAYGRDVDAEVRAEERLRVLADAGRALVAQLDVRATLEAIASLTVPSFADGCTIDLLLDDGTLARTVCLHVEPEKAELLAESARRKPEAAARMDPPVFARLTSGRGVLLRELSPESFDALVPDPWQREAVVRVGIRSYIMVPLIIGDRMLGALSFMITGTARRYDDDDLALAEELARRGAVAFENARLYEAERVARAEAEAANRAKMDFLATMSHELRTPLNAIGGHAQLLEMGIHGAVNDAQTDALVRIQASQAHLLGLINDVLNFAKLDAGKVEYQIRDIPLAPLVGTVVALVAPQFAAKSILFAHTCSGDSLPTARADADKVRQILLNLLSNASKFTRSGGAVTVDCSRDGDRARITVTDTGVGIPAEKIDHIFEPFVQLGRSLSTAHEGTGLGLAISRDLARAMGGDLVVASVEGGGSRFALLLPVA